MTSDLESSPERSRRSSYGDRAAAGALLVLTLPLFVFVSLLIKWGSPGPIFQTREHIGIGGRRFRRLSFRTTVHNSTRLVRTAQPTSGLGYFLRQTRIENLPELINVLRGEISLNDAPLFGELP